jgi:hypothetical protein
MVDYSNFTAVFTQANSSTSGLYGAILPFVFALIAFAYFSPYGFNAAFTTAAFLGFVVALPLFALGITAEYPLIILLVLTIIGALLLWKKGR